MLCLKPLLEDDEDAHILMDFHNKGHRSLFTAYSGRLVSFPETVVTGH